MRNFTLLIVLWVLTNPIMAQKNFAHPIDYNNYIVEEMNMIVMKNLEYISQSVHSDNFEAIEAKRKNVIRQIKGAHKRVNAQKAYDGGEQLKIESLAVLQTYQKVFEMELSEANMLKQTSQESYEAMERYFKAQDKAERNLGLASERFQRASMRYAKKHKIDNLKAEAEKDGMVENELKRISDVNEYTRKLFLAYFKVSKQNGIFFDAVNAQNKAGLEGKRKRVAMTASSTLDKLNTMEGFRGDTDFLEKTKALVLFYKNIAENGYRSIVKVVKKQQSDLTKEDVDGYNEAIEKSNIESPKLLNAFNEAQKRLLQKNIPKHNVTNKRVKRM